MSFTYVRFSLFKIGFNLIALPSHKQVVFCSYIRFITIHLCDAKCIYYIVTFVSSQRKSQENDMKRKKIRQICFYLFSIKWIFLKIVYYVLRNKQSINKKLWAYRFVRGNLGNPSNDLLISFCILSGYEKIWMKNNHLCKTNGKAESQSQWLNPVFCNLRDSGKIFPLRYQ